MNTGYQPAEQRIAPKTSWNAITAGRLLVVLVVVIFVFAAWFYPKGWPVLILTASVAMVTVYLLFRFASAFLFERPFQYSIRSLLIFTAVIAVTVGWMTFSLQQAARQKKALGPWCQDKGEFTEQPAPTLLCDMLGDDFFRDVSDKRSLDFSDKSNATDADLEFLKGFSDLRELHLRSPEITEAGLKHVKDLKELLTLDIRSIGVTDAGLEQLKGLYNLRNHNKRLRSVK